MSDESALILKSGQAAVVRPAVTQAETDDQVIAMWLHGRSPQTLRAYQGDLDRLQAFVAKPLRAVTVGDLQAFTDSLAPMAARSRARTVSAIKSLFSFAQKIGYVPFNVAAVIRLEKSKGDLARRILPKEAVQRMLAVTTGERDQAVLRLLYGGGLRASEVTGLAWADFDPREGVGCGVTVMGKGGKTRVVLISPMTWAAVEKLRGDAPPDARSFPINTATVWRIVRRAAQTAGLVQKVSPHWLRHCHVSHALDRGAPAHLVARTVGHASLSTTSSYAHARPTESSGLYLPV